jgi:hypothetical protein
MPGLNPWFSGSTRLITMYRGGLAGAWERYGLQAGYLVSKLMRQWHEEGVTISTQMSSGSLVSVPGQGGTMVEYKVPQLLSKCAALFNSRREI